MGEATEGSWMISNAKWEKCCLGIVAKRLLVVSLRRFSKQIVAHFKLRLSYTCHYFLCLKAGASHIGLVMGK